MTKSTAFVSVLLAIVTLCRPASAEVCGTIDAEEASIGVDGLTAIASRECDLYWSGTLPKSDTPTVIRVDRAIDDLPDSFKTRVVTALQEADQALVKLGPSAAPDGDKPIGRNLIVIFTTLQPTDFSERYLASVERNGPNCFMLLPPYLWQYTEGHNALGITIAHELFHCVQEFTVSRSIVSMPNEWWFEGSAEWFGIMAQPTEDRTGLARNFEMCTDDVPLPGFGGPCASIGRNVDTAYTWPFFAWYSEKNSAHAVIPFLNELPARTHTPESIANKLSHRDWAEFAKRYAAFNVWMTDLGAINPRVRNPQPVEEIDEGRYTIERPVSQMIRERVRLPPGRWALKAESSRSNGLLFYSRTKGNGDPDGNWVELATRREVKTVCGEPLDLMIAGYGSDPESRPFSYLVEKVDDVCDVRCDSVPAERNQCVIGTWELQNHDTTDPSRYGEFIVEFHYPPPTYSFGADGRYAEDHPFYRREVMPPGALISESISHFTLNGDRGYWGSEGSSLATCAQQNLANSWQVMVGGGERHAGPLVVDEPLDPPLETQFNFECEDDTLILNHDSFPGEGGLLLRRLPEAP